MSDIKCFYCEGDMSSSTTTYVEDFGTSVIVVRDVPCLKCDKCGEIAFSGVVMRRLEQLVDEWKNSLTEIVIATYKDSAA